jgi:transcriptional activator protein UGA3
MTSTSQHGSSSPVHPLFGLAGSLYDMLDLVNQLPSECLQRGDSQINIKSQQLEKALQDWCVVPDQAIHHANIRLIREATMAAEAIRWAVLIRLYQIISHHQNQSDFYQDQKHAAVQNILNCISNISLSSPANSQLLLPLFMAGLCATRKTERLQIEYRLTLVESTVALGNISSVHQLLDMFWKRSHNGEEVDWEELLRTEYPYALLF